MVSKTILFLCISLAIVLMITSEVAARKELAKTSTLADNGKVHNIFACYLRNDDREDTQIVAMREYVVGMDAADMVADAAYIPNKWLKQRLITSIT
ncbi:hypothetical protein ACH5RR_031916 [Cinchona calisaya]|uniref:Uncharacterized protein n=1 Tax=Cinchona calisaya TaxID=153742 RepID=A0ABD2YGL1_9GENT